jgi:hypothetical protein
MVILSEIKLRIVWCKFNDVLGGMYSETNPSASAFEQSCYDTPRKKCRKVTLLCTNMRFQGFAAFINLNYSVNKFPML